MERLSHIRIVLVNPTHPGNIGAAARAMKNMGLRHLALVGPRDFPSDAATVRAAGADEILADALVCDTLEAAIRDCGMVIGASARRRTIPWPELDPRACAAKVAAQPVKTAILFGREHAGLTNEELERCHFLLHIPCNPEFSSLNIAAAVQVVAYELFVAASEPAEAPAPMSPPATAAQMESFFQHLESTLYHVRFLHDKKSSPALMRRIRRIYQRAALEQREIHILRGILTAIQEHFGQRKQ